MPDKEELEERIIEMLDNETVTNCHAFELTNEDEHDIVNMPRK